LTLTIVLSSGVTAIAEPRVGPGAVVVHADTPPPDPPVLELDVEVEVDVDVEEEEEAAPPAPPIPLEELEATEPVVVPAPESPLSPQPAATPEPTVTTPNKSGNMRLTLSITNASSGALSSPVVAHRAASEKKGLREASRRVRSALRCSPDAIRCVGSS
jgi:hypothetical protein